MTFRLNLYNVYNILNVLYLNYFFIFNDNKFKYNVNSYLLLDFSYLFDVKFLFNSIYY